MSMTCPKCGHEMELSSKWDLYGEEFWIYDTYFKCQCGNRYWNESWIYRDNSRHYLTCPMCGKDTMRCLKESVDDDNVSMGYLYHHICMNENCGYALYQDHNGLYPERCQFCAEYYGTDSSDSNNHQPESDTIDNTETPDTWIVIIEERSTGPQCNGELIVVWESNLPPSEHELGEAIGTGPCTNMTYPGCEDCTGSYIVSFSLEKYTHKRAVELGVENTRPINR